MKITSKGQVTIPQAVREQARLLPHSEVEFEVRTKVGTTDELEVIIRPVASPLSSVRKAFQSVRGSANATQFKNMGTDEFMAYLRG
jgi:bifunctional DNA-binding transcriptional regulator/antitoxin component of YhaV-PrlF toxin-antitoxin module